MKIPPNFHAIWTSLGDGNPGEIPKNFIYNINSWKYKHPGWKFKLWRDRHLFTLENQNLYNSAKTYAGRSDILRLEIIYKHGGIYVDTDFQCLKPIGPLIKDTDCFVGCEADGVITNAIFGATPGHPTIKKLIDALPAHQKKYKGHSPNITSGPVFWTKTLDPNDITMIPPKYLYPTPPAEISPKKPELKFPQAYAIHHWSGSWINPEANEEWCNFLPEWYRILGKKMRTQPIEKIFHTIWVGGKPFPEEFKKYRQTWFKHHPDWTMMFWDDTNLPVESFINKDLYYRTEGLSSKADIAQYELLYKYGGVYIDADFECYKNIEPLIRDCDAFGCGENDQLISTGFMGFRKGHPLLKNIMGNFENHMARYPNEPANVTTGPIFLTETIGLKAIRMLPTEYFYPYSYYLRHVKDIKKRKFPRAYGAHHWAASWQKVEK